MHHAFDRYRHKRCAVARIGGDHALRKAGREAFDFGPNFFRRFQRVGSRGQLNRDPGGGVTIERSLVLIVFRADLHAGHIAQVHHRAVAIRAQNNILKLLRTFKPRLRRHRGVQILSLKRRQRANFTAGNLRILRFNGGLHVRGHQTVAGQLERIKPDAHGVLRAKNGGFTHAFNPAQWLLQGTDEEIADIKAG